MTLKVQLVMLRCKKNLFVQFVMCSCLFYILTMTKLEVVAFEIT